MTDEHYKKIADAGFNKIIALYEGASSETSSLEATIENRAKKAEEHALIALELAKKYNLEYYVRDWSFYGLTQPSGYCYKKGFYDFCIITYEKYMKWTILAASNGNAFSVSKLQVYLTTALDSLDSVDHSVLIDFLDITDENYVLFLSKLLCDELVEILEISPEELVKMPEKFMEQTEEIQKVFDKAKMEAANRVIEKLNKAAQTLNDEIEKEQAEERKLREEEQREKEIEEQKEEVPSEEGEPKQEVHEESNLFKRKPGIKKKFRY